MRTLSSNLATQLGLTVTRPGHLVRMAFSTPAYFSTLGTVTWLGSSWIGRAMRIDNISSGPTGSTAGRLTVSNMDDALAALILTEGIADRGIKIYSVWAGATSDADVILMFDGVGDACDLDERNAIITLTATATRTMFAPRRYVSPGTGFNHLQPTGTKITIGGQAYILER